MRGCLIIAAILLSACKERGPDPAPSPMPDFAQSRADGETRARIAVDEGGAAELRTGANVPVALPAGFAIYPGATVTRNTQVARGNSRRVLVEFSTPDSVAKVMEFHHAQAVAAGVSLTLDLRGTDAASIGGSRRGGGEFAVTARRNGGATLGELAISTPAAP